MSRKRSLFGRLFSFGNLSKKIGILGGGGVIIIIAIIIIIVVVKHNKQPAAKYPNPGPRVVLTGPELAAELAREQQEQAEEEAEEEAEEKAAEEKAAAAAAAAAAAQLSIQPGYIDENKATPIASTGPGMIPTKLTSAQIIAQQVRSYNVISLYSDGGFRTYSAPNIGELDPINDFTVNDPLPAVQIVSYSLDTNGNFVKQYDGGYNKTPTKYITFSSTISITNPANPSQDVLNVANYYKNSFNVIEYYVDGGYRLFDISGDIPILTTDDPVSIYVVSGL